MYWSVERASDGTIEAALLPIGVLIAAGLAWEWRAAVWATLGYGVVIGIVDRLHQPVSIDSDVMAATREAIGVVARGGNPYAHFYVNTRPRGSPFPYLPGEIGFYAIPNALVGRIEGADRWAGIALVLLLATLALHTGVAPAALATSLYATFSAASFRAVDGSNDTALALLMVLSVVFLVYSENTRRGSHILFVASAVTFAWALLFKQFSWLIFPFVVAYLRRHGLQWRLYAGISLGLTALVVLPFFVSAPAAFTRNVVNQPFAHKIIWGMNVWSGIRPLDPSLIDHLAPIVPIIGAIAVVVIGVVMLTHPASTLALALFQGLGVLFVALFLARWTTPPYYVFAAAVFTTALALYIRPATCGHAADEYVQLE